MRDEHTAEATEHSAKKRSAPFDAPRRKLQKHASRLLAVGLLLLVVAAAYAAVISVVVPKRYDLAVGATARENIAAPREIFDKLTTEEHQRSAEYSVAPVQTLDTSSVEKYEAQAAAYFESLKIVRVEANRIRDQKLALEEEENALTSTKTPAPSEKPEMLADDWRAILADADFSYLKSFLPMEFADIEVMSVLLAKEDEMLYLSDAVLVKIKMALRGGLDETSLTKAQTSILQELDAMNLTEDLKRIAAKAVNRYVAITLVKDEAATLRRQQEASEAVQPVVYKKGDTLVKEGETVTPAKLEMLEELGLVRPAGQDIALYFGVGISIVVLMLLFGSYVTLNRGEVLERPLLLGILLLLTVGAAFLSSRIDTRINLTFVGAMLISLLVSEHVAIAANIAFAFIYALLCGGQGTILSQNAFEILAATFAGGTVGVYLQRKAQKRTTLMLSGVIGGLTAAALMGAMALMLGEPVVRALVSAGWVLGSYTISAVFCIGTLPFWEAAFDITTASRLMELSNANHAALKRLMTEAPGTYHHSMMVASLAEAGAEAIGANGLLARVGAYYHDLGKLRRPPMFMENQKNDNPHDRLAAEASAAIILSHVRDGVTYAQRYKLPSSIQQMIFEHHGTTPVLYFYNKALQEAGGKPISLKSYRYPGSKPRTRESAIVMLADSVEAAVRSVPDQNRDAIEQMVKKIIKGKLEDEQLSNCPLTFADVSAIERAFIASLSGMLHERIEYPNMPLLEDKF